MLRRSPQASEGELSPERGQPDLEPPPALADASGHLPGFGEPVQSLTNSCPNGAAHTSLGNALGILTNSCPNGAAHTSPGQRPGNHTTNTSAFYRNAAGRRITHPCRNGAFMPTVPIPACMPTIRFPGLHPGLVCVDPLGQQGPGAFSRRRRRWRRSSGQSSTRHWASRG